MALKAPLQRAINQLNISDVTLKSITARLENDFIPEYAEETEFVYQIIRPMCRSYRFVLGKNSSTEGRRVVYEMFAGLRLLKPEDDGALPDVESRVCATIESEFYVHYEETRIDSEFIDEECITTFGAENVPMNLWPYWREAVQAVCSRMGMPRIVLPTHRLKRSATAPEVQSHNLPPNASVTLAAK